MLPNWRFFGLSEVLQKLVKCRNLAVLLGRVIDFSRVLVSPVYFVYHGCCSYCSIAVIKHHDLWNLLYLVGFTKSSRELTSQDCHQEAESTLGPPSSDTTSSSKTTTLEQFCQLFHLNQSTNKKEFSPL